MMAATDSFSKIISNLAGTVGSSSAGVMKTVVTNVSTSTAEKIMTVTNYIKTPNAKLMMHILFLQALVVFHARGQAMLTIDALRNSTVNEDSNIEHKSDQNRGWIDIPIQTLSSLRRVANYGICWISASSSVILTGSVCFDVLFHYKMERVHRVVGYQTTVSDAIKLVISSFLNEF